MQKGVKNAVFKGFLTAKLTQKPPSRKGRNIETVKVVKKNTVEEQVPLKQGLKPLNLHCLVNFIGVEEQVPLKQGLKHTSLNT